MNNIIWLIGAVVVVLLILSFFWPSVSLRRVINGMRIPF